MTRVRIFISMVLAISFGSLWSSAAWAETEVTRFRVGVSIGTLDNAREEMEPFRVVLEKVVDRPVDLYLIDTMGVITHPLALRLEA